MIFVIALYTNFTGKTELIKQQKTIETNNFNAFNCLIKSFDRNTEPFNDIMYLIYPINMIPTCPNNNLNYKTFQHQNQFLKKALYVSLLEVWAPKQVRHLFYRQKSQTFRQRFLMRMCEIWRHVFFQLLKIISFLQINSSKWILLFQIID